MSTDTAQTSADTLEQAATAEPVATRRDDSTEKEPKYNLRADAAATLRKLGAIRKTKGQAADDEKEYLADARALNLEPGDYYDGDEKIAHVGRPESFDATVAAQVIPASLHATVSKTVADNDKVQKAFESGVITRSQFDAITTSRIDPDLARDNLPPAMYRQCRVPAANPTIKPAAA